MTRVGRRLIEDFLLPSLEDKRYGERLMWVDRDKLYFSIRWSHKNAAKWSLEDTVVFQDWDKMKGHFHPEVKGYYMQSKQRFRAALYKLNTVRKLRTDDKHTKLYQLVLENDKKRHSDYAGKLKLNRDRPSVICRNINYIEKKTSSIKECDLPIIKNEVSYHSGESTMFSDASSNSFDRCSVPNDQNQMYACEAQPMETEIKEEKCDVFSNISLLSALAWSQRNSFQEQKESNFEQPEMSELKHSELSRESFQSISSHSCPLSVKHEVKTDLYCSRTVSPVQESSVEMKHPESPCHMDSLHNRHVPVIPSPVYLKASVQPLPPRYPTYYPFVSQQIMLSKNDHQQPVDLSMKRTPYENSHIPVSAR